MNSPLSVQCDWYPHRSNSWLHRFYASVCLDTFYSILCGKCITMTISLSLWSLYSLGLQVGTKHKTPFNKHTTRNHIHIHIHIYAYPIHTYIHTYIHTTGFLNSRAYHLPLLAFVKKSNTHMNANQKANDTVRQLISLWLNVGVEVGVYFGVTLPYWFPLL